MACRIIQFEQGGLYHIFNRSTERIAIFRCMADYQYFLSRMLFLSDDLKIRLHAWALLPTHYHMMSEQQSEITISFFIQRLCGSYGKYFNNKYERTGRLFAQEFKAKSITDQEYQNRVGIYIENNAIHHSLVENMKDWLFSSIHWSNQSASTNNMKNDLDEFDSVDQLL